MKVFNSFLFIIIVGFFSCNGSSSFTKDELRFIKPFSKIDTVIYKSEKGQVDTIIFYGAAKDTVEFRNIEQGFYNDNILRVGYEIAEGSYHKIMVKSVRNEPENFITFSRAKRSYSNREINFLGLLFDNNYLKKVIKTREGQIVFNEQDAKYKGLNVNESIKSFKFDFEKGIISYIDNHGIEWVRSN